MTDDEAQRLLNAYDEFYQEDEPDPETAYVLARIVVLVLSSAVSASVLYWVWRVAHG